MDAVKSGLLTRLNARCALLERVSEMLVLLGHFFPAKKKGLPIEKHMSGTTIKRSGWVFYFNVFFFLYRARVTLIVEARTCS